MKYINKKRIPKYEINEMALMISPTIEDYFDDPKHQKEFEEWKRSRSTKKQKNVIPIKKEVIKCSTGLNTLVADAAILPAAGKTCLNG